MLSHLKKSKEHGSALGADHIYTGNALVPGSDVCEHFDKILTMTPVLILLLALCANGLENPLWRRSQITQDRTLHAIPPTQQGEPYRYLNSKTDSKDSPPGSIHNTHFEQGFSSTAVSFPRSTSISANPMQACCPTHPREIQVCSFGSSLRTMRMPRTR